MKTKKEESIQEIEMSDVEMLDEARIHAKKVGKKCFDAFMAEDGSIATGRLMCVAYNTMARMINNKRRYAVITPE